MHEAPPLSRHLPVSAITPAGIDRDIKPTDAELQAIIDEFGLVALRAFDGKLVIRRSGDVITVDGRLQAEAVQSCIVSLQPVTQRIDQAFTRTLTREAAAEPSTVEEIIEIGDIDPPDVYAGDSIDIGGVVLEEFALALDPYPRAPGVEFTVPAELAADEDDSPFAVLKTLGKPDA